MTRTIICNYNLFDVVQNVYVYREETDETILMCQCTLENLGATIGEVCYARGIDKVHLYGHEEYAPTIIDDIKKYEDLMFSQNLVINVEVN